MIYAKRHEARGEIIYSIEDSHNPVKRRSHTVGGFLLILKQQFSEARRRLLNPRKSGMPRTYRVTDALPVNISLYVGQSSYHKRKTSFLIVGKIASKSPSERPSKVVRNNDQVRYAPRKQRL